MSIVPRFRQWQLLLTVFPFVAMEAQLPESPIVIPSRFLYPAGSTHDRWPTFSCFLFIVLSSAVIMSLDNTGIAQAHKRQHEIIGLEVGFTVFSGLILALRLWSRAFLQAMPLSADDWTISLAWLLSLVFGIDVCLRKFKLAYITGSYGRRK